MYSQETLKLYALWENEFKAWCAKNKRSEEHPTVFRDWIHSLPKGTGNTNANKVAAVRRYLKNAHPNINYNNPNKIIINPKKKIHSLTLEEFELLLIKNIVEQPAVRDIERRKRILSLFTLGKTFRSVAKQEGVSIGNLSSIIRRYLQRAGLDYHFPRDLALPIILSHEEAYQFMTNIANNHHHQ